MEATGAEIFSLSLLGEYQLRNAAVVLTAVEALRGRGFAIPSEAVRRGLSRVQWPARFEVLSRRPVFILDGGHNPQCAEALARSLQAYFPGQKMVFLMGMLADKDYRAVIDIVSPFAAGFVCLTPDSPRALPARDLVRELAGKGMFAQACGTPGEGIREALALAAACGKPAQDVQAGTETFGKLVRDAQANAESCGKPAQEAQASDEACAKPVQNAQDLSTTARHGSFPQGKDAPAALPVIAFGSLYMAGDVRRAFPAALRAFQK